MPLCAACEIPIIRKADTASFLCSLFSLIWKRQFERRGKREEKRKNKWKFPGEALRGRSIVFVCRGGGMPRPPTSIRQTGEAKAFSLGLCPAQRIEITMTAGGSHTTTTRCHAFWRDGCGAYRLSGQSDKTHWVPSTPVTACAVPPSPSGRGLGL